MQSVQRARKVQTACLVHRDQLVSLADLETGELEVELDPRDSGEAKARLGNLEHPAHQELMATQDDKERRALKDNKEDQVGYMSTLNNINSWTNRIHKDM